MRHRLTATLAPLAACVLAFTPVAHTARADIDVSSDAGTLISSCRAMPLTRSFQTTSPEMGYSVGFCLGMVLGVAHTVGEACLMGIRGGRLADISGASDLALIQAVLSYSEDHPDKWDTLGAWFAAEALSHYFPCTTTE